MADRHGPQFDLQFYAGLQILAAFPRLIGSIPCKIWPVAPEVPRTPPGQLSSGKKLNIFHGNNLRIKI
jgi:hypothetical protein